MTTPRLSLVLPTYNEAANLERMVRALIEKLEGARVRLAKEQQGKK